MYDELGVFFLEQSSFVLELLSVMEVTKMVLLSRTTIIFLK